MTDTKKTQIFIWSLVVIVIIALIIIAAIPPVNAAVIGWFQGAFPGAFAYLSGIWAGIVVNPLYQTYHVFIWVIGTFVLAFAIHQAHAANKLPIFKVKQKADAQPVMREPQTIIVSPQPIPTTQPAPTQQQDQTKQQGAT